MPPLTSALKIMIVAGCALIFIGAVLFLSARSIAWPNGVYEVWFAQMTEIRCTALALVLLLAGLLDLILAAHVYCSQSQKQ